ARRKFAGQRVSLDALCERFNVDNSARTKHGALLDAELLAEVYLELSGGRQRDLGLAPELSTAAVSGLVIAVNRPVRPPRPHMPSVAELAAHAEFLKQITAPLWLPAKALKPAPQPPARALFPPRGRGGLRRLARAR